MYVYVCVCVYVYTPYGVYEIHSGGISGKELQYELRRQNWRKQTGDSNMSPEQEFQKQILRLTGVNMQS